MSDIRPKEKEILLKNRECSSIIGKLYQGNFFQCEHTTIPNYSLCEDCSIHCHTAHSIQHDPLPKGDYDCYCCNDQHQTVFNKDPSLQKNCFYEGMLKEVDNLGFYSLTENNSTNIYCIICFEFCLKKKVTDNAIQIINKADQRCDCPHHSSLTPYQIMNKLSEHFTTSLFSKAVVKPKYLIFTQYLGGFNFNIFIKNPKTNEVTMKYIYETLVNVTDSSEDHKRDINNPYFQNALQFFITVAPQWSLKGYYLNTLENNDIYPKAMKLIKEKPNFNYSSDLLYNHYQTQIHLLFFLYYMYIRGSYLPKNNQWILQTIHNMNINQRFKYLHKKNVGSVKAFSTKGTQEEQLRQQEIISILLDTYIRFYRDFESAQYYQEQNLKSIFPCFLKAMKFSIKYCLVNEESIFSYLQITNETINKNKIFLNNETLTSIQSKSKEKPIIENAKRITTMTIEDVVNFKKSQSLINEIKKPLFLNKLKSGTPTYIIKSIFYYLLYSNDKYTMDKINLKFLNKHKNTNFIFSEQKDENANQLLENVKNLFYNCTKMKNLLFESHKVTGRIFDLMTQTNSHYTSSLNNLKLLPENHINPKIQSPYASAIKLFLDDIRRNSHDYFSYKQPIKEYSKNIDKIIKKFKEFIEAHFTLDNLSIEYLTFLKENETDEKVKQSIKQLNADIKDSIFYQALSELIIIIGTSEDFQIKNHLYDSNNQTSLFTAESKKFILQFLFLLLGSDMENLCLIMNFEAFIFTSFFYCIQNELLCFFNRIVETLYSSSYSFSNLFFIEFCLYKWLTYMGQQKKDPQLFCLLITQVIQMTSYLYNRVGKQYKLDISMMSLMVINSFKGNGEGCKKLFAAYFNENYDEITKAGVQFDSTVNLIINYFQMISRFESLDFSRYHHTNDEVTDSFIDYKIIPAFFRKIIATPLHKRKVDIKLIYPLLLYYIQRTYPFRINPFTGNEVISNFFKELTIDPNKDIIKKNILSNTSLISLFRKDKIGSDQSNQIQAQLDDLFEKMDFIVLIAKNYEQLLKDYSQGRQSFPSLLQLKITAYLFIQNVLLKPSYYYIKALEKYLPFINGIMFNHARELIFYLYKAIEFFYLNINLFNDKDDQQANSINTNQQFKEYINIDIQFHLSVKELDEIHQEIIEMADMKYFMIDKYIKKYEALVNKVYIKDKQAIKQKSNFNKKIDDLVDIYETEMRKGSQFVKFKPGTLDLELFKLKDFELRNNNTSQFPFAKFSKITYLSAIIQSAVDLVSKKEDQIALSEILKQCSDEEIISFFLTLITFCNIQEMISMFHLRTTEESKEISIHALFIQPLTKYLQVLCEGNNIIMKEYLFNIQFKPVKLNVIERKKPISNNIQKAGNDDTKKVDIKVPVSKEQTEKGASLEEKTVKAVPKINEPIKKELIQEKIQEITKKPETEEEKIMNSLFNIICTNMKIIQQVSEENTTNCLTTRLYSEAKNTLYINSNLIYSQLKYLLIEMIQGYTFTKDIFSRRSFKIKAPFAFYYLCQNIYNLLLNKTSYLELTTIEYKTDLLIILINIINQEHSFNQNTNFLQIFHIDNLSNLLVFYIRYLYLYYCKNIKPHQPGYDEISQNLFFNEKSLKEMMNFYKRNESISQDKVFKLSQNIYFFIALLGEKCNILYASRFIGLGKSPFISSREEINKQINDNTSININTHELTKISSADTQLSAKIFLCKFFNKIIKKIELFKFTEGKLEIKKVYFLLEPKVYIIDNEEIGNILENADRSSRISKLKSIVDSIPNLANKVRYKIGNPQRQNWLTDFNYSRIDLFNCIFAVLINLTYLEMLDQTNYSSQILSLVSLILEGILICVNGFFFIVFLFTKYPLYHHLNISNYHKNEEHNIWKWLYVIIFESFIFHKEIKMMILVTLIALFGIITPYDLIFFTLQLLTIGSFIPTIKDIMNAFVMRFDQFFAMISFLAIFVFAYANYGFYSLSDQYSAELDNGEILNTCTTLLECFITLFSNGVRSGGGIGDVLGESSYTAIGYWERYIHDSIFFVIVILFLLNMINGIVVGTFSQLREENTAKEEDMTNLCYICSISIYELEKQQKTFKYHFRNEHNVKTYVRYLVNLYLSNINELDQDQYYVYDCLNDNNLEFFPLFEDKEE